MDNVHALSRLQIHPNSVLVLLAPIFATGLDGAANNQHFALRLPHKH
jgi:hypothetical protein